MSSEWFIIIDKVESLVVYTFSSKLKLILVTISQTDLNIFLILENLSTSTVFH